MRTLLIPIAALILMGASKEVEVAPPQPSDNEAVIKELRERLEQHRVQREWDKKLGIARKGPLDNLLKNRVTGLGSRCQDQLERADEDSDADTAPMVTPGPLLRRGPDNADKPPLAIYAVDRREAGCGVMVMMGNPTDVRPVPSMDADDHRLMPAEAVPDN